MTSFIHDCVYKKIFSLLPELIRSQGRVLLYPAGAMTKELIQKNVFKECNIIGISDKSCSDGFDAELNVTTYSRASIFQAEPEYILICSLSYHNAIMSDFFADCLAKNIKLIDLSEFFEAGKEDRTAAYIDKVNALLCSSEIRTLLADEKYKDKRRLEPFGYKCYSQHDEDGMLAEVFRRLGDTLPHSFVEFGVGDGLENNSLLLLKQGWQGLWIEGGNTNAALIKEHFAKQITDGVLRFEHQFIDKDNINQLIGSHFNGDIGMLCIDIDGNDYYVWENINVVKPWVVVIEYNAKFPPPMKWSIEYNKNHIWSLTDYQGASLAALAELGAKKNYQLVGCNLNGTNAIFVRKDKIDEQFLVTDELLEYYHPPRYFLTDGYRMMCGHVPDPRMGIIL
ncbi:hypothetical protein ACSZN3_08105 [Aeromonas hydrophila]|uniref:hypothetical protein n=1 Tax=Aeromonas hydrophila TaxID=644 RepID=UPI002F40244F